MAAEIFQSIPARPAPVSDSGLVGWLRANLFGDWRATVNTLIVGGVLLWFLPQVFNWAVLTAYWLPSAEACRPEAVGACWGVVAEKYRLILFGRYPFEEQWRPLVATFALMALLVGSCTRAFWKPWLAVLWVAVLALFFWLMAGGGGLSKVETDRWGGLPLTLLLSTLSIAMAFPLALLVALGRRSNLPAIRTLCTLYVELIRGVPLISVLFMASVMFPLFLPEGMTFDKLLRAQVGIILFTAAYLAEVIRGGLQALSRGQYEAADSLGLSYPHKTFLVVLPQALRLVIPPMVNSFIGLFKDTSLVVIIGIFDLLNAAKTAIVDPAWQGFGVEAYVFVSIIYFVFCFAMSKYSEGLETELNRHRRR